MKTLCIALAGACCLSTSAYALDVFSIRTASTLPISVESCNISIAAGEVLDITADDLELRLGLPQDSLQGITITALPTPDQGGVYLDGVEVEVYEFLDRNEINRLCFVPGDGSPGAGITFVPQGSDAVTTSLSIQVLETPNLPPEVRGMSVETVENVSVHGTVSVYDPEGDAVEIQVLQAPGKGEVVFTGASFVYTPFTGRTGADSFTICAVDSRYNYSAPTAVDVMIESNYAAFAYADLLTHPSQFAAIKLHEKGIYTGTSIGQKTFLQPDAQMNRGQLLVLLLCAADLDDISPTVNTGLPNDASIPLWLKPYVKKGIAEEIIPSGQPFVHTEIPMRAEAVLMTDRAAKISDVKEYPLQLPDQEEIPDWALPSYVDLAAYKMLDLHDGKAYPHGALTNSYAIDLAWQLWKHCHR